ncbi:MAG: amidase family protein, partial [Candidatus Dormibacteria bacterium]
MSDRTALETAAAVARREVSASELAEIAIARVEREDARVGAFLTSTAGLARAAGRRVDAAIAAGERLPLAGVALAIKDNMCVTNTRTTCGSRILGDWIAPY